jgi:hypothetical protein
MILLSPSDFDSKFFPKNPENVKEMQGNHLQPPRFHGKKSRIEHLDGTFWAYSDKGFCPKNHGETHETQWFNMVFHGLSWFIHRFFP